MEPIRDPEVMRRMELAFDLYEFSDQLMRQNLRRRFPQADETEIQRRFVEWLQTRPGAEYRDGPQPSASRPSSAL
jgi:hypothetical protein